jgi:sulfur carrier protein ThiS adenylyltransferase
VGSVDTGARSPVDPSDDAGVRARLAESHVALIGCGGLGSNAANMLVRSGVGELTLIDFDVVDETNLNRQLFFADQIGRPKTEALAETIRRITQGVILHVHTTCATEENLVALVGTSDVVIEAVDTAGAKAMIANTIMRALPDVPLISASGIAGFSSANEIITERIGQVFYLVGDLESDVRNQLPLLASRVMVAAAHEAHAAIRILLGHPEP